MRWGAVVVRKVPRRQPVSSTMTSQPRTIRPCGSRARLTRCHGKPRLLQLHARGLALRRRDAAARALVGADAAGAAHGRRHRGQRRQRRRQRQQQQRPWRGGPPSSASVFRRGAIPTPFPLPCGLCHHSPAAHSRRLLRYRRSRRAFPRRHPPYPRSLDGGAGAGVGPLPATPLLAGAGTPSPPCAVPPVPVWHSLRRGASPAYLPTYPLPPFSLPPSPFPPTFAAPTRRSPPLFAAGSSRGRRRSVDPSRLPPPAL